MKDITDVERTLKRQLSDGHNTEIRSVDAIKEIETVSAIQPCGRLEIVDGVSGIPCCLSEVRLLGELSPPELCCLDFRTPYQVSIEQSMSSGTCLKVYQIRDSFFVKPCKFRCEESSWFYFSAQFISGVDKKSMKIVCMYMFSMQINGKKYYLRVVNKSDTSDPEVLEISLSCVPRDKIITRDGILKSGENFLFPYQVDKRVFQSLGHPDYFMSFEETEIVMRKRNASSQVTSNYSVTVNDVTNSRCNTKKRRLTS